MICAEARLFSGAVADGQVDLVPLEAAEHVADCGDCTREVEWQRATNVALAATLAEEVREDARLTPSLSGGVSAPPRRRSLNWLAATAMAAVVLVAVGVGAVVLSPSSRLGPPAPDLAMADAVHSFGAAPEFTSTDMVALNSWAGAHGATQPPMSVSGASCVGARSGTVGGAAAVTYLYKQGGATVEVSAMPGAAPGNWPMSETRMMSGMAVGMVHHGNQGLIVVTGEETRLMSFISQIQ